MTLRVEVLGPTPGQPTHTTRRIGVYNSASSSSTWDVQVGDNPRFEFCVCPIYSFGFNANSFIDLVGLNQSARHYLRARERFASGAVDEWSNVAAFTTLAGGAARVLTPAPVMIEPAMLVIPEPIISISGINVIPGFPASNLLRDDATAWRSRNGGDATIYVIDIQTAGSPVDTLALLNTNIPADAGWRLVGGATAAAAADGSLTQNGWESGIRAFRASDALPGRPGYHGLMRFPVQAWPFYRLYVYCTPTGGIVQAQNLVLGLNRVTRNHSVDKVETPTPLTTIERKRSGVFDRVRGLPMRRVEFELSMLTETQYETIYGDLWRYENEPVFVVPNSKAGAFIHDRMLFGDLTGGRTLNPYSPRYSRQFAVNSII